MELTPPRSTPASDYLDFVRRKAVSGMSSDQIAADYAQRWNISYELAKQRMKESEYRQAMEAGYQSGLGRIWEKLHHLAMEKNDQGILLLLAKEQLKLFGQVESEDLLAKSSLSKDKLKKIHELIFGK
jgi:hypothetical protein